MGKSLIPYSNIHFLISNHKTRDVKWSSKIKQGSNAIHNITLKSCLWIKLSQPSVHINFGENNGKFLLLPLDSPFWQRWESESDRAGVEETFSRVISPVRRLHINIKPSSAVSGDRNCRRMTFHLTAQTDFCFESVGGIKCARAKHKVQWDSSQLALQKGFSVVLYNLHRFILIIS